MLENAQSLLCPHRRHFPPAGLVCPPCNHAPVKDPEGTRISNFQPHCAHDDVCDDDLERHCVDHVEGLASSLALSINKKQLSTATLVLLRSSSGK
jgi:hypothetical protein